MDRIPLGVAVTFEVIGPLALAVVLSRRPLDLVWVAFAAVGILGSPTTRAASLDPVGVAFALAAGALWAAYIVLSQRTGAAVPRRQRARDRDGGGRGAGRAVRDRRAPARELLQPELLGALLAVAIASSVLPYSLEIEALRRLPAARVRRADVARAGGRRAGRLRRARPGPRAARLARDRPRRDRQRRGFYARTVTNRGLIALSGREVNRVLKLWTQTVARADPLELAVHPRLRALARRPHPPDRRRLLRRLHRPGPDRDDDGPGRLREQLRDGVPGALRPLPQRRPRRPDARLAGQPRAQCRRRRARAADRCRPARGRAPAHRRADPRAARARSPRSSSLLVLFCSFGVVVGIYARVVGPRRRSSPTS